MPLYRVEVIDYIEVTFEEIWRAWRTDTQTRIYEVEAEDEEEARDIAENYGECVRENYDYGPTDDSDYYDSGEDLNEEYIEREEFVTLVTPKEDKKKLPKPDWEV